MQKSSIDRFTLGTQMIHWLIALLVIGMLIFGFLLGSIPDSIRPTAYMLHKSTGLTILMLMVVRFIWVHAVGKPALPESVPFSERALARLVQYGFYLALIAMPLTGWIMSVAGKKIPSYFGLFSVPFPGVGPDKSLAHFMAEYHETIAYIIIGLLFLHVVGALKHHYYDKDNVLKHMLPWHNKD